MTAMATRPTTLQAQARQVRREFPELFDYINARDEKLQRALRRIPSPADIELSATWNHRRFVERTIDSIGAGIHELAG